MGRKANEISGFREAGDHPARRAIPFAGAPNFGKARHPQGNLLPVVRSLLKWWPRSPGRSLASARSRLEPHSRWGARADYQARARRADTLAAGTRLALYRHRKLFRVRGFRLSSAQSP